MLQFVDDHCHGGEQPCLCFLVLFWTFLVEFFLKLITCGLHSVPTDQGISRTWFIWTHPCLQSLVIAVMNTQFIFRKNVIQKIIYFFFVFKEAVHIRFSDIARHSIFIWDPITYFWNLSAKYRHCEVRGRIISKYFATCFIAAANSDCVWQWFSSRSGS